MSMQAYLNWNSNHTRPPGSRREMPVIPASEVPARDSQLARRARRAVAFNRLGIDVVEQERRTR